MLVIERPGVFRGRAYNEESWYVIDTTYGAFEKDVVKEWRERYRRTNRPGWTLPLVNIGVPFIMLALFVLGFVVLPVNAAIGTLAVCLVFGWVLRFAILKVVETAWPAAPALGGHLHAVVPVHPSVAAGATDSTSWYALWEVSVQLHRLHQAAALCAQFDEFLEVVHAPEERVLLADTRDTLQTRLEFHQHAFDEVAEASGLFLPKKWEGEVA